MNISQANAASPLSYTIEGAISATGLGRSTIYTLLKSRKLQHVKVGRRTLIPAASLQALIEGQAA